jgi:hypothetical protein
MRRSNLASALIQGLGASLAALLVAGDAGAYCRTSSCFPDTKNAQSGSLCTPSQPVSDCGIPIFWPQSCVEYSVQQDGSPKLGITAAETEQLMATAFNTWMSANCMGGSHPDIQVTEGPPVTCNKQEYNQMAGNANIVMFHDDSWPYEDKAGATLALTTVTYNLDSGEIYDADLELNSHGTHFTVGDTNVDFDLLSIVTHESGHFLGLAHSVDSTATMFPVYNEHTTVLRKLAADDMAGICAIYPPGPPTPSCDPTPRHGFSPLCALEQPSSKGCCSVAPGDASGDSPFVPTGALVGGVAGALFLAQRRRERRRR